MAYIEKRIASDGEISYRAQIRLKGHPTINETFPNKRMAESWAKKIETEIKEGRYFRTVESKRHTLGELIDRYIQSVMPRKPKSMKKQTAQLLWWKKRIGYRVLADLTPALLREQIDALGSEEISNSTKKRSPATIVRYMAALSHALSIACREWEWIEVNPMTKVSRPKEPRGRVRFLLPEERMRLLLTCKESECPDLYLIVILALSTGARQGELLNLRWADVDLQKGKVTFHETKNGDRRGVYVTGIALDLLRNRANARTNLSSLVFPSKTDLNKPLNFRTAWENAIEKTQIKDFVFHSCRHSAASELAMSGASLAEIAEVLGHKTLAMVKKYSHFVENHTAKVLERMTEKVFGRDSMNVLYAALFLNPSDDDFIEKIKDTTPKLDEAFGRDSMPLSAAVLTICGFLPGLWLDLVPENISVFLKLQKEWTIYDYAREAIRGRALDGFLEGTTYYVKLLDLFRWFLKKNYEIRPEIVSYLSLKLQRKRPGRPKDGEDIIETIAQYFHTKNCLHVTSALMKSDEHAAIRPLVDSFLSNSKVDPVRRLKTLAGNINKKLKEL